MTDDLAAAIAIAATCVLVSAFFSGTEVALFSLRRVDRDQLAKSTRAVDRWIVGILERPRRLIATVLIGNETASALLAVTALGFACRACESPLVAFAVALGITLPLVVLLSEVTAKTLAAKVPLGWARATTGLLWLFTAAITPVRLVIGAITQVILRPLGDAARTRPARDLSEEEFRHLVDAGSAQGQVDARERRLIHRVFEFSDKNVGQVMTPRDRIFALAYELPVARLVKELAARGFSRVPIYQRSLDNVRGIVHAKDLVRVGSGGKLGKPLADVLHEPLFVPRTTPVKRLFLTFKQKKVHMAIVVSEYGKVLGLVTMDDLLAQIFGVLRDERADLQAERRPRVPATGTPAPGVPTIAAALDSEPVVASGDAELDESRPIPRELVDEVSRPVTDPGAPVRAGDDATPPPDAAPEAGAPREDSGPMPALAADGDGDPGDEAPPASTDVELIQTALGTMPTERQMLGLPSRTRTIPPYAARAEATDEDDAGDRDDAEIVDELARRRHRRDRGAP